MKWKTTLLATLLAIAVVSQPPQIAAQAIDEGTETEQFSSSKFWDFGLCAVSIVFAAGTGGWLLAAITCGKAATEHWTK
jgi:hypothetical protein